MREKFNILLDLGKVRITFFVAISGIVGYLLANGQPNWIVLLVTALAIFILSTGSSAFNQVQESRWDAMMIRTRKRPIPTGAISNNNAAIIATVLSTIGLLLLFYFTNYSAFVLGILALVWYNLVYTPLKRVSALAIIPGSLVGAIPPAIGWAAAGGNLADPRLFVVALFFFIWQIPHFWFLLLIYDKDYQRAGFPTLTQYFSHEQLKRITYVWIVGLVAIGMMIPLFRVTHNTFSTVLMLIIGFVLVLRTKKLIAGIDKNFNLKFAFIDINVYVLLVVLIISIDQFI